jgi:four helix bundle protein
MAKSYRDLMVWQRSMDVAVAVYGEVEKFPKSELYGLSLQMRKAAVSVPSNIAEGHGRRTPRQRYKFLEDSLGSLFELETQVELALRLRLIGAADHEPLSASITQVGRGLVGLMRFVEDEARQQPRKRNIGESEI